MECAMLDDTGGKIVRKILILSKRIKSANHFLASKKVTQPRRRRKPQSITSIYFKNKRAREAKGKELSHIERKRKEFNLTYFPIK